MEYGRIRFTKETLNCNMNIIDNWLKKFGSKKVKKRVKKYLEKLEKKRLTSNK